MCECRKIKSFFACPDDFNVFIMDVQIWHFKTLKFVSAIFFKTSSPIK
jgi:hypothetical protein